MKKFLVLAVALFATLMVFAQASKNVQDQHACDYARKKGTVEVWQDYLREFPQGMCSFEAKSEIKDLNKKPRNKGLRWSNEAPRKMEWDEAINYCKNLNEGGYSDWRLPNIDELRTLIQNHSGTQTGGSCQISDKAGKLSVSRDWTRDDCGGRGRGNNFSKLGDAGWFWSSSAVDNNDRRAWYVGFNYGHVNGYFKTDTLL